MHGWHGKEEKNLLKMKIVNKNNATWQCEWNVEIEKKKGRRSLFEG